MILTTVVIKNNKVKSKKSGKVTINLVKSSNLSNLFKFFVILHILLLKQLDYLRYWLWERLGLILIRLLNSRNRIKKIVKNSLNLKIWNILQNCLGLVNMLS